jgi:hypothetical protein
MEYQLNCKITKLIGGGNNEKKYLREGVFIVKKRILIIFYQFSSIHLNIFI